MAATLEDFGFNLPPGTKPQEAPRESPPPRVPKEEPSEQEHDSLREESRYDTEYLCNLVDKDSGILDTRGWPNGITKQAFDKAWENGFQFGSPIEKGENIITPFWNAGHFAYAQAICFKYGTADKELVWKAILENKERHVNSWANSWEKYVDGSFKSFMEAQGHQMKKVWAHHFLKEWTYLNNCRKELGIEPLPIPDRYNEMVAFIMQWALKVIR